MISKIALLVLAGVFAATNVSTAWAQDAHKSTSGVTLSNVRITTDDALIPAGTRSLRIQVDATVQKVLENGAVNARATCAVGAKHMVDEEVDFLGRPGQPLRPGETKTLDMAPFINDGLAHDPTKCEVIFSVAKAFSVGTAIVTYCWAPGRQAQEGVCQW
jgi:hypothetical protein